MRRTLKLLLLLGLGFLMATNKGPNGTGNGPEGGDGGTPDNPDGRTDTERQTTPDGVNAAENWTAGRDGAKRKAEAGRAEDTDGDGDPDVAAPSTERKWDSDQLAGMPNLGNIPDNRQVHILDGEWDYDSGELIGGGHAPGSGNPGKTEFPERWSDDAIMDNISDVARNPGSDPAPRPNGGWVVRGVRDGVEIEVLLNRDGTVWSAYPLSGDGVVFN